MLTPLYKSLISFLARQLDIIIMIITGLFVLGRVKDYIEDNALTQREKSQLEDALNRIRQNEKDKIEYEKYVDTLDRPELLDIMRKYGELQPVE